MSPRARTWMSLALAALVAVVGGLSMRAAERSVRESLEGGLRTIHDEDVAALRVWLSSREAAAETLARSESVRSAVAEIAALGQLATATAEALRAAPGPARLAERLEPAMGAFGFTEYAVLGSAGAVIAASSPALVGWRPPPLPEVDEVLRRVREGETLLSRPFFGDRPDDAARAVTRATMFVASPVLDGGGAIVAVLALGVDPEADFARLLGLASPGRSGETYAFDARGRLLSPGRSASSARAPEGPLTRAMAEAVAGRAGIDVAGYRGPRGVDVIGAWTWLPRHGIGVATEIETGEAYRHLAPLRFAGALRFGMALVLGAASLVLAAGVRRRRRDRDGGHEKRERLGPYVLEEKLGEGGMGAVYRARHEGLRRTAAVKVIRSPFASRQTIARFEREAQLTSRLAHPNTIAIFDYGRTDSGVFYYAMELVEGVSLERLVRERGPQPERRVARIMRQVAASLAEAHAAGLVHRDVKPANVMLSSRPETRDLVKVLDFGLVKELLVPSDPEVSFADEWVGTPLYVAPEVVRGSAWVGPASDLYGVGATAYFLLTGHAPIEAESAAEVVRRKLVEVPRPPSARLGRPIDPRLEALVMSCLGMAPEARPSARRLVEALAQIEADLGAWTAADAFEAWGHGALVLRSKAFRATACIVDRTGRAISPRAIGGNDARRLR